MSQSEIVLRLSFPVLITIALLKKRSLKEEKAEMVCALPKDGLAALNGDDPHLQRMLLYTEARVIMHIRFLAKKLFVRLCQL